MNSFLHMNAKIYWLILLEHKTVNILLEHSDLFVPFVFLLTLKYSN